MNNLTIKRGDTLYATAQFCDAVGVGQSLAGFTIKALLVDAGGYVAYTFDTALINAATGDFELVAVNTNSLPVAQYRLNLSYSKNDVVQSGVSVGLNIVKNYLEMPLRYVQLDSFDGITKLHLKRATSVSTPLHNVFAFDTDFILIGA